MNDVPLDADSGIDCSRRSVQCSKRESSSSRLGCQQTYFLGELLPYPRPTSVSYRRESRLLMKSSSSFERKTAGAGFLTIDKYSILVRLRLFNRRRARARVTISLHGYPGMRHIPMYEGHITSLHNRRSNEGEEDGDIDVEGPAALHLPPAYDLSQRRPLDRESEQMRKPHPLARHKMPQLRRAGQALLASSKHGCLTREV